MSTEIKIEGLLWGIFEDTEMLNATMIKVDVQKWYLNCERSYNPDLEAQLTKFMSAEFVEDLFTKYKAPDIECLPITGYAELS